MINLRKMLLCIILATMLSNASFGQLNYPMPEGFIPPEVPAKLDNGDLEENKLLSKSNTFLKENGIKVVGDNIIMKNIIHSNMLDLKLFRIMYRTEKEGLINIQLNTKDGQLISFLTIKEPPRLLEDDVAKRKALDFLNKNDIVLPAYYDTDVKLSQFGEYETVYEVMIISKTKDGIKSLDSVIQVTINAYTGKFISFKRSYDLLEKYPKTITTKEEVENLIKKELGNKYTQVNLITEEVIIKPATFMIKDKIHSKKVWFIQVNAVKQIEDLSRNYKLLFFVDIKEPKIIHEIK